MNDMLKNYIKFVNTLNFNQLVEEGKICSVKLIGTVVDLSTGTIKSQDLYANKMSTIFLALCQSTIYNGVTEKEIEFICETSPVTRDIVIETINGLVTNSFSEALSNIQELIPMIRSEFKSKDELLTLAKYIILLCGVDGSVTLSEKQFIKIFDCLLG
ncbi:MAG: hypothetical protein IJE14_07800 [Clostridia bacterium]|nr:hypothetical protein [Clostridia bacterium]